MSRDSATEMTEATGATEAQIDAASSFVPSLVRVRARLSGASIFDAAVLFVDAVGFTSRASAMVDAGPEGLERVSALLDGHYAQLLSVVEERGGEAIRFVGDAMLALFPADGRSLADAARAAVECARALQERRSDDGALAVRAAVTAGAVRLHFTGTAADRARQYVASGAPFEELAGCIARSRAGSFATSESVARLMEASTSRSGPTDGAESRETRLPFAELRAFVPASVLARIESGHLEWLGELRRVSVVFVSAPRVDDELMQEARAIVERHSALLKEIVVDDKGWTLVAASGVPPFAGTDDAPRAARLARDLAAAFSQRTRAFGVGVASGRAFCGAVGTARRREYAIVGAAMNLASRLAGIGDGRALCDEETARSLRGAIATTKLSALSFKGFRGPVGVYEVGDDLERGRSVLAGRAREREEIVEMLARGEGAAVYEGEAGIGKSHLLDEAATLARGRGTTVLRGSGDPALRAAAYHPWRSIFEGLHALAGSVDALSSERDLAPLFSAVLGAAPPDNEVTRALAGQPRADRTRQLLVDALAQNAARSPLLLVIEDLHAADPPSLELLQALIARKPKSLVILASSRPTGELASLGAELRPLSPLAREATAAILMERLGASEVDPALVDHVHARAAGNPLFIEQLSLSLAESKAVHVEAGRCTLAAGVDVMTIELPPTVQGAITARLDRLAPALSLTLKTASVAGASFADRMIADVHPHPDDRANVALHLEVLSAAQLLEAEPEAHRFRHDLVREVAYDTMLFAQRRSLHRDIAAWFEREHHANLNPHLALLAHHHRNAGDSGRAVDYLEREAIRAFSIGLARQSVAVGVDAAQLLGVDLPRDPESAGARIGALVGETMTALQGRKPSDLLTLPALADAKIGRTIKLLLELAPFTFQAGRPELYAVLALTCLALTLEHGSSAPDVYSTYSVVHRGIHRDARGAYAWSQLAIDHDAKTGGSARARVAFVHGWFHNHWVRPFATSVNDSLEAAEIGIAAGDVLFGCYNLSGHVVYLGASGRPLPEVMERASAHHARNAGRVVNAAFHCLHELQVARALAGKTRGPMSLSDDAIDEARDLASICASDYYNQAGYYLVSRVKLHALFGDPAGALAWAAQIGPLAQAISGQVAEIDLVLYRTLAEIDLGKLDLARETLKETEAWAAGCPENFLALHQLLAAACADGDAAREGFARAGSAADTHGQLHLRALADERLARLEPSHTRQAVASYRAWGAHAKADQLEGARPLTT